MLRWERWGISASAEGTTITYLCVKHPEFTIESRRRKIPHANREGTWDYTSYFVLENEQEIKELHTLKDAKAYVEELLQGGNQK